MTPNMKDESKRQNSTVQTQLKQNLSAFVNKLKVYLNQKVATIILIVEAFCPFPSITRQFLTISSLLCFKV